MKTIQLANGRGIALVDDADWEMCAEHSWRLRKSSGTGTSYAITNIHVDGKKTTILLHRFIVKAPKDKQVDHRNGNGLDCRRDNMRLCTHQENCRNRKKQRGCSSIYKGVSWSKQHQLWQSRGIHNQVYYHLGYFASEVEAARAYNTFAVEHFKEFAKLNVLPQEGPAA